jgi:SAM-dependent methyltransferase
MDNQINQQIYESDVIVDVYKRAASNGLTSQEDFCFSQIPDKSKKSVLDIGIGGGRTVGPLSDMFGTYIGIDYAEPMVIAARENYPGTDLRAMDARHIELEKPVDCAVFSFNGISSVSYENRLLIFQSIANAVKPGGYFVYSAHSLTHDRVDRWMNSMLIKEMVVPTERIRFAHNRLRMFGKQELSTDGSHAYVNDPALGFKLINVYVNIEMEKERLASYGFEVLDEIGNKKSASGYDGADNWVYFVTRKTG